MEAPACRGDFSASPWIASLAAFRGDLASRIRTCQRLWMSIAGSSSGDA